MSLTTTVACIESATPDDEHAQRCFNFTDESVIRPRPVELGEMVTVNADGRALIQLRPVSAPG